MAGSKQPTPKSSSPSSRSSGSRGAASSGTRQASGARGAQLQAERAGHDRINAEGGKASPRSKRSR